MIGERCFVIGTVVALAVATLGAVACGGDAVHIERVVALDENCAARVTNPTKSRGTFDIGASRAQARDYVDALVVSSSIERVTFDRVDLWYSANPPDELDPERSGAELLPTAPDESRTVTIGATSASEVVFVPTISELDVTLLIETDGVRDALGLDTLPPDAPPRSELRFGLISHVRVRGRTPTGDEVTSQELPIPIDLCNGCLDPGCGPGSEVVLRGCIAGQDDGFVECTP